MTTLNYTVPLITAIVATNDNGTLVTKLPRQHYDQILIGHATGFNKQLALSDLIDPTLIDPWGQFVGNVGHYIETIIPTTRVWSDYGIYNGYLNYWYLSTIVVPRGTQLITQYGNYKTTMAGLLMTNYFVIRPESY